MNTSICFFFFKLNRNIFIYESKSIYKTLINTCVLRSGKRLFTI